MVFEFDRTVNWIGMWEQNSVDREGKKIYFTLYYNLFLWKLDLARSFDLVLVSYVV